MNCARDHHHRPLAILDGGGGERNDTPGVVVGRMRQVQRAYLLAVLVPVNVAEYGCAHGSFVTASMLPSYRDVPDNLSGSVAA